jgi:RNA polymerase sigma-70 factor (ECF subfamily)
MTQTSAALAAEGGGEVATPAAEVLPLSDRVLLERHVRGDREAFSELVRTYANSVNGYLARCGVPAGDRDDVFQDVFCKVHRALASGLPDGPVRPWLFAIAVNAARDSFRRAKVRRVVRLEERAGEDVPADARAERPDRAAEARETAMFLESELGKLPLDQREPIVLCCIEGMSLADAASALGAPVDTIKTRLRRGRLALADAMHRRALVAEREESR